MPNRIIDDQDASHITYQGIWAKGGSSKEYGGTVASSTRAGDSFALSFYGNVIAVYGTIDVTSTGVQSSYSIDGAPAQIVTAQGGAGDTYNQQFWKSTILDLGRHQLNVTMLKVNADPKQPAEGTIWFDYFSVSDPTIRPRRSKTKTGAIVGGVVGGVALLALILVVLFLRRRKRLRKPRSRGRPNIDSDEVDNQTTTESRAATSTRSVIIPFTASTSQNSSATSATLIDSKLRRLQPPPHCQSVADPPSDSNFSTVERLSSISDTAAATQNLKTARRISTRAEPAVHATLSTPADINPIQHTDSGVRNIAPAHNVHPTPVELPPVYSPV